MEKTHICVSPVTSIKPMLNWSITFNSGSSVCILSSKYSMSFVMCILFVRRSFKDFRFSCTLCRALQQLNSALSFSDSCCKSKHLTVKLLLQNFKVKTNYYKSSPIKNMKVIQLLLPLAKSLYFSCMPLLLCKVFAKYITESVCLFVRGGRWVC